MILPIQYQIFILVINNKEADSLCSSTNVFRLTNSRKIACLVRVVSMGKIINEYKILDGK
jgi:hypothetical protein